METELQNTVVPFADRFTGCLLGMAIGDALGVSRAYKPQSSPGQPLKYLPRLTEDDLVEIPAGQYSLNTELALCLLETLATSDGFIDPELAAYRFENAASRTNYLAESREMRAVEYAASTEKFQDGGDSPSTGYAGPAARVTPVALVHSLADLNIALVTREIMRSVLLTEASPLVVNGALAVAHAARMLLRQDVPLELLIDEILSLIDEDDVARALRGGGSHDVAGDVASVVSRSLHAVVMGDGMLEPSLSIAFAAGGATHLSGAIVGALCGCYSGASKLDQALIDGLRAAPMY